MKCKNGVKDCLYIHNPEGICDSCMKGVRKVSRELKFRVWSKQHGMSPSCSIFDIQIMDSEGLTDMSQIEIMQYTGLHDKNGREIYEGDIVEYESKIVSDEPLKCLIEYEEDASILCINGIDRRSKQYYRSNCVIFHKSIGEDCEIIGNIHDNPEMLKESD